MTATPLITAAEGFPALERLILGAHDTLLLSFRVLDPDTRLRSAEAREKGLETWGDLIADAGARGVALQILVTDFDAIFTRDLHRQSWQNATRFAAQAAGRTQILCAPHGQRAGPLWAVLMRHKVGQALRAIRRADGSTLTPVERAILKAGPILRPATLHQKFAIADGVCSIIGGLDVDERRYDTPGHDRASDETWHDVSLAIDDADFAAVLAAHFTECWNDALECGAPDLDTGATPRTVTAPPPLPDDLSLLRTRSIQCAGVARLSPRHHLTEHADVMPRLIAEARDSLYIETQFLRDAGTAEALAKAGRDNDALNLVIVLPAAAERVLFDGDHGWDARHAHGLQMRAIERLRAAYGDRLAVMTTVQPRPANTDEPEVQGAPPVYVHAKVMLVDDAVTVVGSANLNGRSLYWDTEASAVVRDQKLTTTLRDRLAGIWLRDAAMPGPARAAHWNAVAQADAKRDPDARKALVLPFPRERGHRFSRRMVGLPDAMF
ncbi:phospholipase D family protein [Citreimonas sp.]|uniref:phospholipase D family protein n=1 Tax=Citreimonas sp. TaxID=3036715 RepID=UPI004059BEFB